VFSGEIACFRWTRSGTRRAADAGTGTGTGNTAVKEVMHCLMVWDVGMLECWNVEVLLFWNGH
jgi:hypothetical protein